MRLIFNRDAEVAEWVGQRLGQPIVPPFTTLGWIVNGRFGGCVFSNRDGGNVELTFAMDGPITRGIVRAIAHYVFKQLGCSRVTMKTRRSNDKALKAARQAGFKYETNLERWYGSEDGVQFKMTSDKCRWI